MPLAAWRENSSRHVASLRRIRLLFFIAPVSSTITGRDYPQWTDLRKYVAELPVTSARRRSSWRSWERPNTPTPRRRGRRACRTGLPPTSARSSSCRPHRVCLFRIISRARSNEPVATNRRRPAPTRTWRAITARLRHRQFFSLLELNAAIGELLVDLNHRPFKKLDGCRASAFAAIDRPAMKPLPGLRYEYAEWLRAKVNVDYHVEVDHHYYSVPHALVGQYVMARFTASVVECCFKGRRVSAHVRSYARGK